MNQYHRSSAGIQSRHLITRLLYLMGLVFVPCVAPAIGHTQESEIERISTTWVEEPLRNVLLAFADYANRSILPAAGADGLITAEIVDQPWDVALRAIVGTLGLVVTEDEHGIIHVTSVAEARAREEEAPLVTRVYAISYATPHEATALVASALSPRGTVATGIGASLVVSDVPRSHDAIAALLGDADVPIPQVSIKAKIVFVDRTGLDEMGISYELLDTEGNRPNVIAPTAAEAPDAAGSEQSGSGEDQADEDNSAEEDPGLTEDDGGNVPLVQTGTHAISLDGNSIAALGNAARTIAAPTLRLITTLVLGRHRLVSFLDALEAASLSEIEAEPQVTTLDSHPAEIHVGEVTPIRTIDVGATGAGEFPTAQVSQQETGIILRATPHVTADGAILLELEAERSAAEPAASDAGFIFRTQRARTRVLVKDGETVVIGGLTHRERVETLTGIPLLMRIPLLGRLFQTTRTKTVRRDLVIMVTPTVVESSGGSG